jgi:hypothetical protein
MTAVCTLPGSWKPSAFAGALHSCQHTHKTRHTTRRHTSSKAHCTAASQRAGYTHTQNASHKPPTHPHGMRQSHRHTQMERLTQPAYKHTSMKRAATPMSSIFPSSAVPIKQHQHPTSRQDTQPNTHLRLIQHSYGLSPYPITSRVIHIEAITFRVINPQAITFRVIQ